MIRMQLSTEGKLLNRDVIKYIAMFTMLLNHIANALLPTGTFLCEFFIDIGYFTAITMCYFLVEGYEYTRSKRKYLFRLALFAVISEIPFCLALTQGEIISFCGMNMMFTLMLCFLIIHTVKTMKNGIGKDCIILGLTILSIISDWALFAPMFTLLFLWAGKSVEKLKITYIISAVSFGIMNFIGGLPYFPLQTNILYSIGAMAGIVLSGICILYFYNGKRMQTSPFFSKWFFYLFYPVHLFILGVIRIMR